MLTLNIPNLKKMKKTSIKNFTVRIYSYFLFVDLFDFLNEYYIQLCTPSGNRTSKH